MSLWERLFGKAKPTTPTPVLRDIPDSALRSAQVLNCDTERGFRIGKWELSMVDDPDSQRLGRGVLKKSAGKTLRLEPTPDGGHRGVISSVKKTDDGGGYRWINVDVDLRTGLIRFSEGGG
jgi:hypothetical protein